MFDLNFVLDTALHVILIFAGIFVGRNQERRKHETVEFVENMELGPGCSPKYFNATITCQRADVKKAKRIIRQEKDSDWAKRFNMTLQAIQDELYQSLERSKLAVESVKVNPGTFQKTVHLTRRDQIGRILNTWKSTWANRHRRRTPYRGPAGN